jgi:hypothetical protein
MLIAAIGLAALDYMPPTIYWMGQYAGYEYHDQRGSEPAHSYPVRQMLDGDPNTAWMVGGLKVYSQSTDEWVNDFAATISPKLFFVFPKPLRIDGVRIMPGYNKSTEVFRRNNRITGVSLYSATEGGQHTYIEKPFRKARLKDAMGWQEVKFTPRNATVFQIEVTDFVKGTDNDFCVSEIQFLSGGEPIDWELTPLLLSTSGSQCGCGTMWHVVNREGKAIREAGTAEFDSWAADPSGRYVFSNALTKNNFQFYVLDMQKGLFVARTDRPRQQDSYVTFPEVAWKSGQVVARVSWEGTNSKEETITLKWSP